MFLVGLSSTVFASGCTEEDSGPEGTAMAGEMLSMTVDSVIPGNIVALGKGAGGLGWVATTCDKSPDVTMIDACGQEVIGEGHYAWSGCSVDLPEGARYSQLVSEGSVDVSSSLNGDCSQGDATFDRLVTVNVQRNMPSGRSMTLHGTVTTHHTQAAPTAFEVLIDLHREMSRDGSVMAGGDMSGTVSVTRDGVTEQQTLSGTMTMSMHNPHNSHDATIQLTNVVRDPVGDCRWPTSGQIVRTTDGETHSLEFGSTCGVATLDGAAVDLNELSSRMGKKGHGNM
jgi:hypothetical protein